MKVNSLGYVVFESPHPDEWEGFARDFLGGDVTRTNNGAVSIRFDERHYRILVEDADAFSISCVGWEVANRAGFESGLATLDAHDVKYEELTPGVCGNRHIEAGVRFSDPLGTTTEVYFGGHGLVEPLDLRYGVESLQLGHVLFGTENQEESLERFYVECLGFKVSDYLEFPYGSEILRGTFLRAGDGRHHSIAFTDIGFGFEHLKITAPGLNDVGRAWDRAIDSGLPIVENLGRHSNSFEVSFYVVGPDQAQLEYGTRPLVIDDDAAWHVRRLDAGSLWGHRVNQELTNVH